MMETFDEQMKKCESIASELSAKSGIAFYAGDIWRESGVIRLIFNVF